MNSPYPIGRSGIPWNSDEKQQWFNAQSIKRSYHDEVVTRLEQFSSLTHQCVQYGALPQDPSRYPLFALVPTRRNENLPDVLVTGGVHGYETSGVQGAIDFAFNELGHYSELANIVILPCISPWGYETINRWGANAVDPNRNFFLDSPSIEAKSAMAFVSSIGLKPLLHIDLHETTDSDNSEFRPALSAKEAIEQDVWQIPDGFYLVADTHKPEIEFQRAVVEAVKQVTHIAPTDEQQKIIGVKISSEGVIDYDKKALNLCAGFTDATYVTTTEVYPDSDNATPHECNLAQVTAIKAAIDYAVKAR